MYYTYIYIYLFIYFVHIYLSSVKRLKDVVLRGCAYFRSPRAGTRDNTPEVSAKTRSFKVNIYSVVDLFSYSNKTHNYAILRISHLYTHRCTFLFTTYSLWMDIAARTYTRCFQSTLVLHKYLTFTGPGITRFFTHIFLSYYRILLFVHHECE